MNAAFFHHPRWPVFYEDNHLLGLYKPAGLLAQSDETGEASLLDLGKEWLKERYGKPGRVFLGLVHRLDRPVAGVLLFARTSKAAGRLSEQFRTGATVKHYLAVVEGVPREKSGRLVHHLERREKVSSRVMPCPGETTQEARLSYRVVEFTSTQSLVEIQLETGRRHQIRLQMSHIGHPIVGDLRYGAFSPLPRKQIALIASELIIRHPTLNSILSLRCPLPEGWPWPFPAAYSQPPIWNWTELREAICGSHPASNTCSFCETMRK